MYFHKIASLLNPSDILSKHTGYPQAWPILKSLLFGKGKLLWFDQVTSTTNGECQAEATDDESAGERYVEI
jgi:hypothetical protein